MLVSLKSKNILITGAAGFIGYALVERFLKEKEVKILDLAKQMMYLSGLTL